MDNIEKGIFLKLFNRGGFVLDFSTDDFDAFTLNSVGVELCTKYRLSKGKSLKAFINDASEDLSNKLLLDLLKYYESQYPNFEKEKNGINDPFSFEITNEEYAKYYASCKEIAQRIDSNQFCAFAEKSVKEAFSSEYINKQLHIMLENQASNPTESIGKAKELIESCCETILENNGVTPDKDWKLNQLVDETMKLLEITPKHVPDTAKEATAIKAILGSLKGIASQIAIVRNAYGSGHGKSASYKGLQERHAKLAIGSSITLVNFLWDSYERAKSKDAKQ
ncbi:MAG: abortive infection family protein [Bacteroidaceae bacterium]|nr:abortive infection family protein [Bacteroidaceae bacterium]